MIKEDHIFNFTVNNTVQEIKDSITRNLSTLTGYDHQMKTIFVKKVLAKSISIAIRGKKPEYQKIMLKELLELILSESCS